MKINFFGYAFILLLAPSLPQFLPFITFCVIFCKSFALLVCWTVYHRITGHSGVNLFINSRMNSLFNWDLTIKFVVGHNDEVTKLKCNFIKKKCVQRKKLHRFKKILNLLGLSLLLYENSWMFSCFTTKRHKTNICYHFWFSKSKYFCHCISWWLKTKCHPKLFSQFEKIRDSLTSYLFKLRQQQKTSADIWCFVCTQLGFSCRLIQQNKHKFDEGSMIVFLSL